MTGTKRCLPFLEIHGKPLISCNGPAGIVDDFLFDDTVWSVRFVVVTLGPGTDSQVLLPREAIGFFESAGLSTHWTKAQIENAPAAESIDPVGKSEQRSFSSTYRPLPFGASTYFSSSPVYQDLYNEPYYNTVPSLMRQAAVKPQALRDPHLRSCNEIKGYRLSAPDSAIGYIDDFLLSPDAGAITGIIVDAQQILKDKKVLMGSAWISRLVWATRSAHVPLPKSTIVSSPVCEIRDIDAPFDDIRFESFPSGANREKGVVIGHVHRARDYKEKSRRKYSRSAR